MRKTRVFAVSGFSGSGKTTLLSKLVEGLREKGKLVAVIKNSKEDVFAPLRTDTRQHQDAGADPVVLLGPNTTTIRYRERKGLFEILNEIDTDYILLEGFKQITIPRFWCIPDGEKIPDSLPDYTKAVVVWDLAKPDISITEIPLLTHSEIENLLDIIESHALEIEEIKTRI